jgi:hypothetical protein
MITVRRGFRGISQVGPDHDRRSWDILRPKSLWTVPEPWKTYKTRFPQLVGRRTERAAHNGPQAVRVL